MKKLPFILLLALSGCSPSAPEPTATTWNKRIEQWIPPGTTLAAARQIMEQHHFSCSVESYNSYETMGAKTNEADAIRWKTGIFENGKTDSVTNMSYLICWWTNSDNVGWCQAKLTVINGKTLGSWTTVTSDLKNVSPPD